MHRIFLRTESDESSSEPEGSPDQNQVNVTPQSQERREINEAENEQPGQDENAPQAKQQPPPPKFKSQTPLKVTFKSWSSVATWKWVTNDDMCGICRVPYDGCCPECKFPGDNCPPVWGECTHCFHIHCIIKWLEAQVEAQACPMCRQEWKFKN